MTYSLLEGLRVLELGRFISAPYCGKLLADLGAEVIKVETPGAGDPARQYGPFLHDDPHPERSGLFLYLNANKLGVTLNLAAPTGQDIFQDLVARCDVLVHNLYPREMERLGLHYDALCQINPGLVMASITPFGLTGPYRDYKAYDINLAAVGGICQGLGQADREPLTFGTPQVGYFAGMAAASSIGVALLVRDASTSTSGHPSSKSPLNPSFDSTQDRPLPRGDGGIYEGQGQHIDIAEAETMAGIYNGPEALMAVYQWRLTRRTGHHALDFPYPNCILRCKDGYIFVGAPEGRQWRKLLELMGNPEWSRDPRFADRTAMNNLYADELDGYLETWLTKYTKTELLAMALEHRIPLAPVRGFDEVRHDPSLADLFVEINRADTGPISYPGPPYLLAGEPASVPPYEGGTTGGLVLARPPLPAPYLGQHNEEVFCGMLGYSNAQLVKLYQTEII